MPQQVYILSNSNDLNLNFVPKQEQQIIKFPQFTSPQFTSPQFTSPQLNGINCVSSTPTNANNSGTEIEKFIHKKALRSNLGFFIVNFIF